MRDRTNTAAFVLLLINITLLLLGALGLVWEAKASAARPLAPTNLGLHFSPTGNSPIVRHDM